MEVTEAEIAPLACGRDAAPVWDRAEAGLPLDAHGRACPHCSAAYAEARRMDAAVHRMAAQPVEVPAQALEAVLGQVLEAARRRLRPEEALRLDSPLGANRLARPAAAAVLRALVDAVDGVRARSCRIEQPGPDPAIDVALTVAARFGLDLVSVTARVRQTVTAAGEQALGLPLRRVDIEVVDLWEA
ncbi:MAG TPA: Asp23/Gls24 family envelope stress response protein [Pseudonocardia sp.]|nr:Asp23/Gls24 family envelope stress response protein [Pseudonocardia sp.]